MSDNMTKDDDQWKFELLKTMLKHGKTLWDAIEFLCSLVAEAKITHRQSNEILRYVLRKGRGPIAIALGKALEIERDEKSNVEQT